MPSRYDQNTKSKAVRLVQDHVEDYESEWAAITTVAGRPGIPGTSSLDHLAENVAAAGVHLTDEDLTEATEHDPA